jgi:WD40 repeat protein
MVCVGDSSDVFLFDISSTGAFSHQATFTASVDSSFSTDFSSTSSMFAVASQDGIVSVWDRRFARTATPASSSGKLATLKTTRVGNSYGAARLVKFSQGDESLREVDIAGACFSADAKSVFVGTQRALWQWV